MEEGKNNILKFSNFFENKKVDLELHYFAFDIDDNLFHMPTVIHMEKKVNNEWIPIDVSTSEFGLYFLRIISHLSISSIFTLIIN